MITIKVTNNCLIQENIERSVRVLLINLLIYGGKLDFHISELTLKLNDLKWIFFNTSDFLYMEGGWVCVCGREKGGWG